MPNEAADQRWTESRACSRNWTPAASAGWPGAKRRDNQRMERRGFVGAARSVRANVQGHRRCAALSGSVRWTAGLGVDSHTAVVALVLPWKVRPLRNGCANEIWTWPIALFDGIRRVRPIDNNGRFYLGWLTIANQL